MIREQEHNGIEFIMFERDGGIGEFAVDQFKYHLKGKLSFTHAKNQYKYGDELIIQVYSNLRSAIEKKQRVNSNYYRIQIFMKAPEFQKIAKEFLERQGWTVEKKEVQKRLPF